MRTDQVLEAMNAAEAAIKSAEGGTAQALIEVFQRLIEALDGFDQQGAEPWVIDGLSVLTLGARWLINQWARHEYGFVDPQQLLPRSFFGVPVSENGIMASHSRRSACVRPRRA